MDNPQQVNSQEERAPSVLFNVIFHTYPIVSSLLLLHTTDKLLAHNSQLIYYSIYLYQISK